MPFGSKSIDRLMILTGEYSKSIVKNNFTLLGGYSYQENDYTNHYMENWDFPTDIFRWHNIGLGRAIISGDYVALINNYKATTNLIGFFGRLNFNYGDRYLLMASVRKEEASELWERMTNGEYSPRFLQVEELVMKNSWPTKKYLMI